MNNNIALQLVYAISFRVARSIFCFILLSMMATLAYAQQDKEMKKAVVERVKELKKEGWKVPAGYLPIEQQVEKSFRLQMEEDEDHQPKYVFGNSISGGSFYNAAKTESSELAKADLAGNISTELIREVKDILKNERNDAHINSIAQMILDQKSVVTQTLSHVIPLIEMYRSSKDGIVEVQIMLAYEKKKVVETFLDKIKNDDEPYITTALYDHYKIKRTSFHWLSNEDHVTDKEYLVKVGINSSSDIQKVFLTINKEETQDNVGGQDYRSITNDNANYDLVLKRKVTLNPGTNVITVSIQNFEGTWNSKPKMVIYIPENKPLPPEPKPIIKEDPTPPTPEKCIIEWLSGSHVGKNGEYQLKAGIRSESKVESIDVTVNRVFQNTRGINAVANDDYTAFVNRALTFKEGENTIIIKVRNAGGETVSEKKIIYQPDAPKPTKDRLALVIGNSDYNDVSRTLKNPKNDASDFAEKLEMLGFDVIKEINTDKRSMDQKVSEFGMKAKNDNYKVVLFFYAGHGIQSNGVNYLIPIDAELNQEIDVKWQCLNVDQVLDYMDDSKCSTKIVILDACRDNPFGRSWNRSTSMRGLSMMNASGGTIIAYATSPGSVAQDGKGSNSPFTAALLKTLDKPNLPLESFFKEVMKDVYEQTDGHQIPWFTTSFTGDLILNEQ